MFGFNVVRADLQILKPGFSRDYAEKRCEGPREGSKFHGVLSSKRTYTHDWICFVFSAQLGLVNWNIWAPKGVWDDLVYETIHNLSIYTDK